MKNKRGIGGEASGVKVFYWVLLAFIVFFVALLVYQLFIIKSGADALEISVNYVVDSVEKIFVPVLGRLLGTAGKSASDAFLMIITFILLLVVIIGTLDSVNIFRDNNWAWLINVLIGAIVSIIGVRYMPPHLWESLTAPSSALVATLLVGLPFLALVVITFKIKFRLVTKFIWLFYVVFLGYLFFSLWEEAGWKTSTSAIWAYGVFAVLSILMLVADSQVRRFVIMERELYKNKTLISDETLRLQLKTRAQLKQLVELRNEASQGEERNEINRQIDELRKELRDYSRERNS
jgi:hypothetical protein